MTNETATLNQSAEVENLTSDARAEWLKTGELPSDKPAPALKEEAAPPEEKVEAEEVEQTKFNVKPEKPNQMGYKALREKLKALEDENARLKTTAPPEESKHPITTTDPNVEVKIEKARSKPLPSDVDDKGKPKYATYEDYVEDLADWKAGMRFTDFQKKQAEDSIKSQQQAAQQKIADGWKKQVESARKVHADFDSVALNKDLAIPEGSVIERWVLKSEQGTELLYQLAKSGRIEEINAMDPVDAARELVILEAELAEPDEKETPPAKRVSNAPPPAREVGSRQATNYDPVDEALAEGDFDRYRAAANAKEMKSKRR